MGDFFSADGSFFKVMNKVGNIFYVSILWLLCCIPVVTIGAATIAMYYTMVKVVRRENGYVSKEYFRVFKENLKNGIIMTIFFLVAGLVLYIDRAYMDSFGTQGAAVVSLLYTLLILVVLGLFQYLFPVMSRFTMGKLESFRLAGIMVFRHLPTTIALILIMLAGFCIVMLIPIPMIFVVPGTCCFFSSFLMEKILLKYMAKPQTESDKEKWYYQQGKKKQEVD